MSGTISTVLTSSYTLTVDPTTVTKSGGVEVSSNGRYESAIVGPSPTAWTVLNEGTVSATAGYGVVLNAGGTVTNSAHALINGSVYEEYANGNYYFFGAGVGVRDASGTVVNSGTIADRQFSQTVVNASGVVLEAGGSVTNSAGGVIAGGNDGVSGYGSGNATITVTNAGLISGNYEAGVGIGAGNLTNSASGTISGSYGVEDGSGLVLNAGTITGVKSGVSMFDGGSVTNASGGVIVGGVEIGRYVATAVGGTVVNAGSITMKGTTSSNGSGHAYSGTGVSILGGGRVINAAGGMIAGGGPAAGGILAGGTGVAISAGAGTVVNAGTISGGVDGVMLVAGYANRVVVDPGAVFNGTVDGGNPIGGPVASTLELAAGARGTLYNLNIQFVDFSHIVIDKDADWVIEASGAIGPGQTLTDAGTLLYDGASDLSGKIALDGGTLNNVPVVEAGAVVSGFGTITGNLIVAAGGTLDAAGGTLGIDDADISGALDGGTIAIDRGFVTLEKGVHGSVHEIELLAGGTLVLSGDFGGVVYRGTFDDTSRGLLNVKGNNVTLGGSVTFVGSGGTAQITGTSRLALAGSTEMGGAAIEGSELVVNSGSLTQSGAVTLDNSAALSDAKGGIWDITSDSGIALGSRATGSITNAGTFEKIAGSGTSVIAADFVNDGTIIATNGTLDFTGGFTNHGTIIENGGTVIVGPQAGPALFNQYVAGMAADGAASVAAAATPDEARAPVLAAPHAA